MLSLIHIFSLPMHPYMEADEQQTIIDAVLEAL